MFSETHWHGSDLQELRSKYVCHPKAISNPSYTGPEYTQGQNFVIAAAVDVWAYDNAEPSVVKALTKT